MIIYLLYTQGKLLAYLVGSFKNVIKGDLISIIPLLEQNLTTAVKEGELEPVFFSRLHSLKYNLYNIQKETKYLNVLQENKILLNLKYKLLSFSEKNKNNPNLQEPLEITEEEIIILIDSLDFYIKVMTGNLSAAFLVVDKYRKYDYDFLPYNNLASGFLCNNTFHDISSKKIFRKVRWGYDIYRGLLETDQKLIGTLPGVKIIR